MQYILRHGHRFNAPLYRFRLHNRIQIQLFTCLDFAEFSLEYLKIINYILHMPFYRYSYTREETLISVASPLSTE